MLDIKNPEIVGVISGNSTEKATIQSRSSSTLIYKSSGESIYHLRGKRYHLTPSTVLFIPENESYNFEKTSSGESIYRLVNFHADLDNAEPRLFDLTQAEGIDVLFRQMENLWRANDGRAEKYELLSLFYKLISALAKSEERKYTTSEQKEKIEPAMEFLKRNIFNSALKISSLHTLCGMSAPTFRRIFESKTGISPRKYVIRQRLTQAKIILESGEYGSISEVAHSVGYDDPLYFSKHFKEFYGSSPSNF